MTKSEKLFEEAVHYIPGGVNSPVRAFGSVNNTPRFIERGKGPYLYDADHIQYIDFVNSWGPLILGHDNEEVRDSVIEAVQGGLSFGAATEKEVDMAKLICSMAPGVEMARMVNSGTEAVMSAVRTARGFTGKNKIIKFEGCYHGHSDSMLVKAGSGVMTGGIPESAGVPSCCTQDTLMAIYNDIESVKLLFEQFAEQIAAVIVEPVGANMGVVLPERGFLSELRTICTENKALLIFDEVITGFRLSPGGAGQYFGVTADLTTFGKIIGAGMPVGAYGGRKEIMESVSPVGPVYQAGTLSGNPVAMAAGITQLNILKNHPEVYQYLEDMGEKLFGGLKRIIEKTGAPCTVNYIGSLGCLFFNEKQVKNYQDALQSDTKKYADYFNYMLGQGIYLAPAQFEAMFLSAAHTEETISRTLHFAAKYFGAE